MTFISKSQVSVDILFYGRKQLFTAVFSDVLDHNSFSYLHTHTIVALQHVMNDFSDTAKCYLIVQDFCATAKSFQTLQLCRCEWFPAILDCMSVNACVFTIPPLSEHQLLLWWTLWTGATGSQGNRCWRAAALKALCSVSQESNGG